MSFLSRWFGSRKGPSVAPPAPAGPLPHPSPPPPIEPPPPNALLLLSKLGQASGPDERQAMVALRSLAHTPDEAAALDAVAAALTRGPLPESVRLLSADLLVERGAPDAALRLLAGASSPAALMLRADLLRDCGEVASAVAIVERILARDIDTPGARERHARWSRELSGTPVQPPRSRDETIAVPTAQHTPFRILREIARGGAGTVYLAHDDPLDRHVALKVYHRPREDAEQMRREATTAIRFAAHGIMRVLDVDYDQGWIALEWIEAGSLRELAQQHREDLLLPIRSWALPLAEALAILHTAGWVHADVKPANVLLGQHGSPLLADFGISVKAGSATLGGSTGFLSPERLAGRPLEPSDDVYGFGRILEEVASCLTPSDETTWFAALAEHCMLPAGSRPVDARALVAILSAGR